MFNKGTIGDGASNSPLHYQAVVVGEQHCFKRGIKEPILLATVVTAPNKPLQNHLLCIKIDSA